MSDSLSIQRNLNELKRLNLQIEALRRCNSSFEERLLLLHLDYRLEDLLNPSRHSVPEPRPMTYGFYVNLIELRFASLNDYDQIVFKKLRNQEDLTESEKHLALLILRRMTLLELSPLASTLKEI